MSRLSSIFFFGNILYVTIQICLVFLGANLDRFGKLFFGKPIFT